MNKKRNKALKLVPVLLLAAAILIAAAGCDNRGNAGSDSTQPTDIEPEKLILAGEGAEQYTIVRSEKSSQAVIDANIALRKKLNADFSASLGVKEDWLNPQKNEQPGEYEILIGDTNRPESAECAKGLKAGDYLITVRGKKLVIVGGSEQALLDAIEEFGNYAAGKAGNAVLDFGVYDEIVFRKIYRAESISIMGKDISEYAIAYKRVNQNLPGLAESIRDAISASCGVIPEIVTDKPEGSCFYLEYDPENAAEWNVKAADGVVNVTVGGRLAADKAADALTKLISSQEGRVSLNASDFALSGSVAVDSKFLKDAPSDLRIMTSNLLFTEANPTGRMTDLSELYHIVLPDVVGFQECTDAICKILQPLCADKYVFSSPDTSGSQNCTRIMYRKDLYTELDCGYERLIPDDYTKSISWTVLRDKSGYTFAVTSIHCSLNPDGGDDNAAGNELRLGNAKQLLRLIADIRAKYPGIDVYSAGDYFNGTDTPAYNHYMSNGFVDPVKAATISHSTTGTHHDLGEVSTATQLDLVIVNGTGLKVKVHRVIANKLTIRASDHNPVYVDVSHG